MNVLYDWRCDTCDHVWEQRWPNKTADNDLPECPECGSHFTKKVWTSVPILEKAKDPYDYLDGPIPDPKRIFSGPKVSSK